MLIISSTVLCQLHPQSRQQFRVIHQHSRLFTRMFCVPHTLHLTQTLRQRTFPSALSLPARTILYQSHVGYAMVTNTSDCEANITLFWRKMTIVAISALDLNIGYRSISAVNCSTWIKVATVTQHVADN